MNPPTNVQRRKLPENFLCQWSTFTYDVFLSFRGEDTRTNFTDHLYNALSNKGIYTFIDRELTRGDEISPALVKAIEESRISLIVFSENYASSRWCLDELVEIFRCKESKQQIVLPIFYKVDPSHVRNQTSKFGDAFKGLIESKFKDNQEKVLIWRKALTKAANLSGHPFKDGEYEATFINNIVDGILIQVLSRTYWNVAKHPVGIQSRVQDVEMLLDVGGHGCRMVGIWGTSGIGKTTIAKAIWNAIAHEFEGSCFLANVRENSMPHGGLIQLQETLLHKYLGKKLKIHSADEGIGVIKERLRHKKILLVLDDVDQLEQLENLAGVGWFGEGSRVIITTKDTGLLNSHGIESIYHVQELNDDQALELFSLNAFGRSEPPKDFSELAQRAIAYAQGLPVALTLLGSHLCNKRIHRWQVILDDYEGEPYTGIQKVLRKSYDALENSVQQVFLDIACFFKGEHKNYVLQIVSSSKNKVAQDCIEVLVEKAMITIECNKILIHDLLEKLGKDIVREESPKDPGKRSRLWFHEDVKQVLMENTGTRKIKGIMVKLPEPDEIPLNEKSFVGMVNLEIFINRNAFLSGYIEYLPNDELRLIDWGRCQLQFLPSNFRSKHLVVFNMPCSDIRILERFKNLPKLTSMNLRGCQFLKKIPDLSGLPNLKCLNLSECTSLVEVDGSVGFLDKLVELDLGGCFELTRFATRLGLKSLRRFVLIDCKRLESFPEIEVKMESLWNLYMEGSGIRELPSSIANLTELRKLSADYCENLTITSLRSIYGLQRLTELSLNGCPKLLSFRDKVNSEVSSSSTELHLHSTNSNISLALPNLFEFDVKGCNLSESDFLLPLDCWSTLTYLDLSGNNFVRLSGCISKFINLRHLYLHDCRSLLEIPDEVLPPRVACIVLDNCTSLEKIPKLPPAVEHLSLINCIRLRGYDIGENIFLNQVYSEFEIHLPGDEVLKWFSCCKDAALVEHYSNPDGEEEYDAGCEVCFEIPPNLKWETLRLVLCVVSYHDPNFHAHILINGERINGTRVQERMTDAETDETHVWLYCIPLLDLDKLRVGEGPTRLQQGNMCQIIFDLYGKGPKPVKIPWGVHLLGHQVVDVSESDVMAVDDDITMNMNESGKRLRGSNIIAVDDHDHHHEEQWLRSSSELADHPKRRHMNIDEEQMQ